MCPRKSSSSHLPRFPPTRKIHVTVTQDPHAPPPIVVLDDRRDHRQDLFRRPEQVPGRRIGRAATPRDRPRHLPFPHRRGPAQRQPRPHRRKIARSCAQRSRSFRRTRVVITHGTDTMTETARVTGQCPLTRRSCSPDPCHRLAFRKAMPPSISAWPSPRRRSPPPGVYIAMSGQVFRADKVRKDHARWDARVAGRVEPKTPLPGRRPSTPAP